MPIATTDYYKKMAEYNAWMNQKIYSAAMQLTEADLIQDRGAFFGSILGTLNHLVASDTLWLKRFALHPAQFPVLAPVKDLPKPEALNQILFSDIQQLATRRNELDSMISGLAASLTEQDLAQVLHYHSIKNLPAQKYFYKILWHFFNHQTHHRGQLSTLLFQLGVDIGATDLLLLIEDEL